MSLYWVFSTLILMKVNFPGVMSLAVTPWLSQRCLAASPPRMPALSVVNSQSDTGHRNSFSYCGLPWPEVWWELSLSDWTSKLEELCDVPSLLGPLAC